MLRHDQKIVARSEQVLNFSGALLSCRKKKNVGTYKEAQGISGGREQGRTVVEYGFVGAGTECQWHSVSVGSLFGDR